MIALSGWSGRSDRLPGQPSVRALSLGLVAGGVYFVGTIYWVGGVVAEFGGLVTPLALTTMLLLAIYLAFFPAVSAVIISKAITHLGTRALLLAPGPWVATEFLRGELFGGFPWVPLGNSQIEVLSVLQLASVFGVYGISALLVFISALIALAILGNSKERIISITIAIVLVGSIVTWGGLRISGESLVREGKSLRVGLVQGNISQEDKWNPQEGNRILTTHTRLTREAVAAGADLVIWPESSVPFMFEEDVERRKIINGLVQETDTPILLGSNQLERGPPARLYNAAFFLTPDKKRATVYRKIHLVPFGEYIPFRDWLFFVSPLVDGVAEFAPGISTTMLPLGNHLISTAICYEVVYPGLSQEAVRNGSELLTNITNDAWYGHTSAPFQHFDLATMRAVEQGRYLVRAANTGISGIVDPYGRILQESEIFTETVLVGEVRLLTKRTLYSIFGDVVAYLSIVLTIIMLLVVSKIRMLWRLGLSVRRVD